MVAVITLPLAYIHLPAGVVATVLGLMTILVVQFTLGPILPGRLPVLAAVGAAVLNVAAFATLPGTDLRAVTTVWNDILLLVLVVGVCNLYAQSGMKARDVAIFAALLTGYDLVATLFLPTMAELLSRIADLPFAPVFTLGSNPDAVVIGLGDVLMLVLWTLVSIKGYGPAAGWLAAGTAVAVAAALAIALGTGLIDGVFPVMVLAGPAIVAEYLLLRRRHGPERTTAMYHDAGLNLDPDQALISPDRESKKGPGRVSSVPLAARGPSRANRADSQ
ncbi:MAG TPA: hypothetical protein VMU51_34890 [Mycobacteriales bacterium]|nr:hypothetical protein [Mycobacteriales bacterium]